MKRQVASIAFGALLVVIGIAAGWYAARQGQTTETEQEDEAAAQAGVLSEQALKNLGVRVGEEVGVCVLVSVGEAMAAAISAKVEATAGSMSRSRTSVCSNCLVFCRPCFSLPNNPISPNVSFSSKK